MAKRVICLFDIDGTLTKPRNVDIDNYFQLLSYLANRTINDRLPN